MQASRHAHCSPAAIKHGLKAHCQMLTPGPFHSPAPADAPMAAARRVWTPVLFLAAGLNHQWATHWPLCIWGPRQTFFEVAGIATTGRQGNKDTQAALSCRGRRGCGWTVGRERQNRADRVSELASLGRSMSGHSRSKPGEGQLLRDARRERRTCRVEIALIPPRNARRSVTRSLPKLRGVYIVNTLGTFRCAHPKFQQHQEPKD
jgi:hypothetical protein